MPNLIARRNLLLLPPTAAPAIVSSLSLVGFATVSSGGGTSVPFPTHAAGHLCIGNLLRAANAAGVIDAAQNWLAWSNSASQTEVSGNTMSIVYGTKVAASAGELWGDWVNGGRKNLWIFENGVRDNWSATTTASNTALTWPALTIDTNAFVGVSLLYSVAQSAVSMGVEGPTGVTVERLASVSAGALGGLTCDTDSSRLSVWAPGSARTLDTATAHVQSVFSVKRAA